MNELILEEMFSDWLWDKYYDEFRNKAIKQVESELGFWKSMYGAGQKIADRHWKLFEEFKEEFVKQEESA